MDSGNGFPQPLAQREQEQLEARVAGLCLVPTHIDDVVHVIGGHDEWFSERGFRAIYTAARQLGRATSADAVRTKLPEDVQLRNGSFEGSSVLDDLQFIAEDQPQGSGDYWARQLQQAHLAQDTIKRAYDLYQAACNGVDVKAKVNNLVDLVDRSTGYGQDWNPVSLKHLVHNPPPPIPPIIGDGCLSVGDWMLIHAREGVGKSWATAQFAIEAAAGKTWFGQKIHSQYRTLIYSPEMHAGQIRQRMVDIAEGALGFPPDQLDSIFERIALVSKTETSFVDLLDPTFQRKVVRDIQAHMADLVIFDPLSHFFSGDENKVAEVRPLLRFLEALPGLAGATPILTHHDRKAGQGKDESDKGSRARGSVAIISSARASVTLYERDPGNSEDPWIAVEWDKVSNGPKPATVHVRHCEHTGRLVMGSPPEPELQEKPLTAKEEAVLTILQDVEDEPDSWLSWEQIAERYEAETGRDLPRQTIQRIAGKLENAGLASGSTRKDPASGQRSKIWCKLQNGQANEMGDNALPDF